MSLLQVTESEKLLGTSPALDRKSRVRKAIISWNLLTFLLDDVVAFNLKAPVNASLDKKEKNAATFRD